jgi:hypothetical protein
MVIARDGEEGIYSHLGHWKQGTGKVPIGVSPKVHTYKGARQKKVKSV